MDPLYRLSPLCFWASFRGISLSWVPFGFGPSLDGWVPFYGSLFTGPLLRVPFHGSPYFRSPLTPNSDQMHIAYSTSVGLPTWLYILYSEDHTDRYLVHCSPWQAMRILGENFGYALTVTPLHSKIKGASGDRSTTIWTMVSSSKRFKPNPF